MKCDDGKNIAHMLCKEKRRQVRAGEGGVRKIIPEQEAENRTFEKYPVKTGASAIRFSRCPALKGTHMSVCDKVLLSGTTEFISASTMRRIFVFWRYIC